MVRYRLPKVTTEAPVSEPQQAQESEEVAFSGGNISDRRLEEIRQPSDTPTSLMIKRFEDFKSKASFDFKQDTNGFGTIASFAGEEIDIEEAQTRLMERVNSDEAYIKSFGERYNYDWEDNEIAALTSFIYNLGRGALDQVTGRDDEDGVGSRTKEEIADAMLLYTRAGGNVLPGLVRRRQDEHDVFTGKMTL